MHKFAPLVAQRQHAQVDDPNIGQTRCHHQAGEPFRFTQVALVQMKATTFLIGEEGFNPKTLPIPIAGFALEFHVGQEINRLGIRALPPGNRMNRSVVPLAQGHVRQTEQLTRFNRQSFKGEFLVILAENDVLGGAANVLPTQVSNGRLQGHAIKLTVAQENNIGLGSDQGLDLI